MVSHVRLLDALHADLARLAVIPDDQLTVPVPSCPGWIVADLLAHLARVHHRTVRLLDGAPYVPLDAHEPTPEGAAAVAWSREVAAELEAAVRGVDPAAPTDAWFGAAPAAFWVRRMAQETSLHRWDAERAVGMPTPVDPDLGADGVDELLEVFLPRLAADRWEAVACDGARPEHGDGSEPRSIHLDAADAGAAWTISLGPQGASVTAGPGTCDVTVRAGGGALDLLVWNRITPDDERVACNGDRGLLDRFLATARF